MSVFHVLKDGSRPTDITGHIVRIDDVRPLYHFLRNRQKNIIHMSNEKKR